MSVNIDNSGIFSRLQLARALKEDPNNPDNDPPENSAIFLRQRARNSPAPTGHFYIPRPANLLTPPILAKLESPQNDLQNQGRGLQPTPTITTNNSTAFDDRRCSLIGKPATLLDVRKSMLDTRQSIHNMVPFSPASSHRTSLMLQQHKSLPDLSTTAKQSHRLSNLPINNSNSRPSSSHNPSSRPTSSLNPSSRPTSSLNPSSRPTSSLNPSSRPTSSYNPSSRPTKSKKTFTPQDSEEDSSSESEIHKKQSEVLSKAKSEKSKKNVLLKSKNKIGVDNDSESSDSSTEKKNKSLSKSKLEKVEEEDSDDTEESMDEDEDSDESESESEDDTPLALKVTPKIKVAPPNKVVKKNGKRVEAWLDTVSNPEPETNKRNRRPPSAYNPTTSSPLNPMGFGYRLSPTPEPIPISENRRPHSSTEDFYISKPQFQQRKRANSEFVPKGNKNMPEQLSPQFTQIGRVSPSPRQDSGYWARDTLTALSEDFRHLSLMNDSSSSNSNNSQSKSDSSSGLMKHRENSSLSSFGSRSHSPQVPSPTLRYSRSRDSLYATNNRQSYYMTNNISNRISSEPLSSNNRVSYYPPQQKYRVR
ncbi:8409_t:CDS:2 [Diversispora eburnea]|uniref:8409_t:CDS:1 n=1 Tax=Diversispora eburnea TaxID=1213867 RepID=A0A9N8Z318_9GLOM|nr:8409_t:CDS:2 [Diversispora eburnea]